MKVNIYETIDITDEQRLQLGAVLTGALKPKHVATRDEIKNFVWSYGEDWAQALAAQYRDAFEPEDEEEAETLVLSIEDLI